MIVIGVDAHKRTYSLAAVDAARGALIAQRTVPATDEGALQALRFAAGQGEERVWALEDCRHVVARLERDLVAAGERVVRVAPALTVDARRAERQPGKSDVIDALAVARAVVREGLERFPAAYLDERAMQIRLLQDYRDQLISERVRWVNRLRWHLVALDPEFEASIRPAGFEGPRLRTALRRRLKRLGGSVQAQIARDMLARIEDLFCTDRQLQAQLNELVSEHCPQLLAEPGCGTITAAIIIGRTAGARRFSTDARFARHTGTAPIPASSGNTNRHPSAPRRRPATKPRDPHHRSLPRPPGPAHARLPRPQGRRGQDQTRSAPLPQTPPRPTHLAHPLRHRPDTPPLTQPTNANDHGQRASPHALRPVIPLPASIP